MLPSVSVTAMMASYHWDSSPILAISSCRVPTVSTVPTVAIDVGDVIIPIFAVATVVSVPLSLRRLFVSMRDLYDVYELPRAVHIWVT